MLETPCCLKHSAACYILMRETPCWLDRPTAWNSLLSGTHHCLEYLIAWNPLLPGTPCCMENWLTNISTEGHGTCFSYTSNIFLLIFEWWLFLSEKMEKIYLKMWKTSIFKIFFPCLYNFTLPKYGTYRIRIPSEPVKIFQIRIRPKSSGSDRIRIRNPLTVTTLPYRIVRYPGTYLHTVQVSYDVRYRR